MKRLSFTLVKRLSVVVAGFLILLAITGGKAFAQEDGPSTGEIVIQLDVIWLFIGAFLVFWMQAGFAMVESGFSRSKNAANLLMKNLLDFAVGTIVFFAIGFGLMYGDSAGGFIGTSNFFLSDIAITPDAAYDWVDFLFQLMFAAAAATIVSGAVAERLKFKSYLVYSVIMTAFIYPISGHWMWGGGWLSELGFIDFAGSTIVHAVGGFAALAAAWILGPRIGKFNKDGSSNAIPGHSLTLAALGVFILWMGWFGFNSGSTLSGMNPGIAYIAVTTTLSAAAGTVSALIVYWVKEGHPSTEMALNGALAGLVAITAGTASVTPVGAIAIGLIAGPVLIFGISLVERVFKVDDPVGAVAVHGLNGVWGTLAVGLFASAAVGEFTDMGSINGLFYGGGLAQFGVQAVGTISVAAWAFVTMGILFYIMKRTIGIRVSPKEELEGLDISEHFTTSYPEFGPAASDIIPQVGD
ncbi:MAG: ammonium transporter [Anaerolineae bacterium]|nr:ammonium transporter [Anaerolineae bacterium]MCO5190763.1 ammonium transporter [Anaerolineae bacterium]MCO5192487.1 ammonium transporter [Anaerolineae bacterium]MCO5207330.1 ammonium transporter [Anaerolineae bacterium]